MSIQSCLKLDCYESPLIGNELVAPFNHYSKLLACSFHSLPAHSSLIETITEIFKRVALILSAPLGLPLLGAVALTGAAIKWINRAILMMKYPISLSRLVKGPYDGLYESHFIKALNDNQSVTMTPLRISLRYDRKIWENVEANYNSFMTKMTTASPSDLSQSPKIPHKIHLIWLGKPPTEEVNSVVRSWKEQHPDWSVQLWRNEDSEALISDIRRQFPNVGEAWDKAGHFAEKADILRYSIIYKEGGLYVDTDLPSFGHVRELHQFSDFYACIEETKYPRMICGNAALAARPDHPLVKRFLEEIKPREKNENKWTIIQRTGPELISRILRDSLSKTCIEDTPLILPPGYFFPLPYTRPDSSGPLSKNKAIPYVLPYSKGLHLWNGSWL